MRRICWPTNVLAWRVTAPTRWVTGSPASARIAGSAAIPRDSAAASSALRSLRGIAMSLGLDDVETVGNVQVPRLGAAAARDAVLPEDRLRSLVNRDHPMIQIVRRQDIAVGQFHRQ